MLEAATFIRLKYLANRNIKAREVVPAQSVDATSPGIDLF